MCPLEVIHRQKLSIAAEEDLGLLPLAPVGGNRTDEE
jgi:hypothetical protein